MGWGKNIVFVTVAKIMQLCCNSMSSNKKNGVEDQKKIVEGEGHKIEGGAIFPPEWKLSLPRKIDFLAVAN